MGIFGGDDTTVVNTTRQKIKFEPTTNVSIDTEGLGEGVDQGISNLGEGIQEGLTSLGESLAQSLSLSVSENIATLKDNALTIAIAAGVIYLYFKYNKKGAKVGKFKIQLPALKNFS